MLNQFNPRTRELLYAILLNTTIVSNRISNLQITFYYKEVQRILEWDDKQLLEELDVLWRYNILKLYIVKKNEPLFNRYKMVSPGRRNSLYAKELFDKCMVFIRIEYFSPFRDGFLPSIIKYLKDQSSCDEDYKGLIKKLILDLDFTILN
ncbi:hypothetical protein [Bacillus thuringiensis]|uniref:hypothetical protein n=1 Tax=Bacillus thuringiensis TaxID=1428 RepID=UPI0024BC01FA|nr:hypothetical protein [Bacillus thuringiensis]